MELNELIQQGRVLKSSLQFHTGNYFDYYTHANNQEYESWLMLTRRYINTMYTGDKFVTEFELLSEERNPTPELFDKMLAILEAMKQLPEDVKGTTEKANPMVAITNTQNQSQSKNVMLKVFVEALHEELSGKQIRELKSVAEDENLNEEEKKSTILDKIKEFGKDTLASIVANVLTNPTIWGMM